MKDKERKSIKVPKALHKKLKVICANKGLKIYELLEELLKSY